MKGIQLIAAGALLALSQVTHALNLPINQITFDNHSDIYLGAMIAGLPGKDIPPQTVNFSVPFTLVFAACSFADKLYSCPVNFRNKNKGNEEVASVLINVVTGEVVSPPELHGNYRGTYNVTGWDTKPLNRITISKY